MKTIFITVYDGAVAKSIVRTKVLSKIEKEYKVVLFVSPQRVDTYRAEFPEAAIEVLPPPDFPRIEEWYSRALLYGLPTQTIWHKIQYGRALGDSLFLYVLKNILWRLGHSRFLRRAVRQMYLIHPDRSFDPYIKKYKPDLVWCAAMISDQDARLLKAARRFRIFSIGMPKSWDNLSTKSFFRVLPDRLLVQSDVMKGHAISFMDMPPRAVETVGFPQFDIYADHTQIIPREEFCRQLGFDPAKKIILYAAAGDQLAPHDEEVLADLLQAFSGGLQARAQILVRPHPKYKFKDYLFSNIPYLKIDYPGFLVGKEKKEWEFAEEDVQHLMNSLYHADVVVNTASTLIVEAAIFDKPIVVIDYDGHAALPVPLRVGRHYSFEHLQFIMRSGGVKRVSTAGALFDAVRKYLDHPELDQEGRARIVASEVGVVGEAAEHIAQAVSRAGHAV